jgi:hypothetical protein
MERREKNGRTRRANARFVQGKWAQQAIAQSMPTRIKQAQAGRRTLQKVARLVSLPRRSGRWLALAALDGPPFSTILRQESAVIPACS